ncbi:SDR family NAD(P)-dependent oxidoreductase [Paenibacillus sp. S-38]|uniref:SDR family NAD(P)-dependent oxidoreductase n=1 Tax=Paenibacillus sp. S-38 TaxID=3416710 RepID=UPI003CEAAB93
MSKPMESMNSLLLHLLEGQLRDMGWLQALQDPGKGGADLPARLGIKGMYDKWLAATSALLAEHSAAAPGSTAAGMEALWQEWDRQKADWLENPNVRTQAALADAMIRALPDILTGNKLATDIMFPDGGMEKVEGIYKNNLVADHFNAVLAEAARLWVSERIGQDSRVSLRILEIGAGTGGTSAAVLPVLRPYAHAIGEYCYTDISKAFLLHAEKEYGPHYPFLTYRGLNIEEPLAAQGIRENAYDAVIATNVLHATRNMRHTVRNAKALLKKDGLLLINEITEKSVFTHVTFGLLAGWWAYEDASLRIPGCPGLYPDTWRKVLQYEGFRSVSFPAVEEHSLGQQVITAVSDGVIRQKRSVNESESSSKRAAAASVTAPKPAAVRERQPVRTTAGLDDEERLRRKGESFFKEVLGRILKVPSGQIDVHRPLADYGLDSILVIQATNALRKTWSDLGSTLFFQYSTVHALTQHFMTTRKESLAEAVGLEPAAEKQTEEHMEQREGIRGPLPSGEAPHLSRWSRISPVMSKESPGPVHAHSPDVAVIGLAGRYAQAQNIGEFWRNLKSGKHCITEIPEDRWRWQDYEQRAQGAIYTKWGGFIKDIDKFDPLFFRISPREAEKMDPQERLFLETAYACIEDAGYTPDTLGGSGNVGVFVGVMNGNYPTGAAYWSVANRVSYVFNFRGPSMAVDTACSSSLTALHLAVESLHSGTSECVMVGGVNLIVDPQHYLRLAELNMLSPGSRCKAFGDQADGFVDGEGVGAVILKPLHKAIADHDHIYGVIKGTMLNGGGKTNGYTVPNPEAQFRLVSEAMRRAGIHARSISYVEAHGTGTALGDPIEIEGLKMAFARDTADTQFCSIGSVKSNIGHCESAAGMAGLSKVLLQLKYRQLVPSLHSGQLNPHIDFRHTPFQVQQDLAEWRRPVVTADGTRKEYPRRAGISSFGAGGANAHVLIEEYSGQDAAAGMASPESSPRRPVMVVLSAKNEERLAERVRQLLAALEEQPYTDRELEDIAYTLQVGREAMEERLGLLAASVNELERKLRGYLDKGTGSEDVYRGQVKRHKETLVPLDLDEDMAEVIEKWIGKGKYAKLLQLWVKGLHLDWSKAYAQHRPRRISLPAYPFAGDSYWTAKPEAARPWERQGAGAAVVPLLHPLLHRNSSVLWEQRFTSVFTGDEFFLADHKVLGRRVLPGVAYLEMARKAAQVSVERSDEEPALKLKHVTWTRPVTVDQEPVQVHIRLLPEENDEIRYEIYGPVPGPGEETVTYSQGTASVGLRPEPFHIDLSALRGSCDQGIVTAAECYAAFEALGLGYGPALQGIETLYRGRDQVLARLSLPPLPADKRSPYVLHPSVMDSALQASIVLMTEARGEPGAGSLALPFAVQEMEVLAACASSMWAWVRYSEGARRDQKAIKLDIDLCDDLGKVCVSLRGFSSRAADSSVPSKASSSSTEWNSLPSAVPETAAAEEERPVETVLLTPVWEPWPLEYEEQLSLPGSRLVMIGGTEERWRQVREYDPDAQVLPMEAGSTVEEMTRMLEDYGWIDHILWIAPGYAERSVLEDALVEEQEAGVLHAFRMVKSLLALGYETRDLRWTVVTQQSQPIHKYDPINPTHASLHGFVGSMAKEYPHWHVALADLEGHAAWPLTELLGLPGEADGSLSVYRDGQWHRQELVPVQASPMESTLYKDEAVYVVIGGAGGIGEAWSEYMIRTYRARIIWIGRREPDAAIAQRQERLSKIGPAPVYIAADASDPEDLQRAYQEIKGQFERIHGVIHSAIVLSDKSLAQMEEQQFRAVLAAKIDVSVAMAKVFRKEPLDFVLFFSSFNSFTKAPGQSNYVAGCTFKDAFAHQLSLEWPCVVKVMNWGYWGSVGIVASDAYQKQMDRRGIRSIEPAEAMAALEVLLSGPVNQLAMMKTEAPQDIRGVNWEKAIACYSV